MQKYSSVLAGLVIITAILACNLPSSQQDPGTVMTAAALTVQAQLSLTVPPLSTPTATNTPVPFPTMPPATLPPAATPTSSCDNAHFVTDVTYPDNTVVTAGDNFTKTWRFQNYGTCSWTPSYTLVFLSGDLMNGPSTQALTGNVNPGQTVDISVNLTAPSGNGTHVGNWGLRNASGVIFAHFYVQIKVGATGGGPFAVTHVDFSVTGSCGNFHTNVSITTNGSGTVNYHKVYSDGGADASPGTLTFASAGTQSFDFDNSMSAAHTTTWIDIYIDNPNHQQFGRAYFTCP
jgi:Ig-like domain from next to BRCA1 gene